MKMIVTALAIGLVGCGIAPGLKTDAQSASRAKSAGVSLELLSYNTWGLPKPIGRRIDERFAKIAGALGGYDLVGLQETFTGAANKIVAAKPLPYVYRQTDGGWMKLNSGLTLLSRYPIRDIGFRPFKQCDDFDCQARKGVLFARLAVPGIGPVDVYNTHYQAHAPYGQVRRHDNDVLRDFVAENDSGYPTFMLGDFNLAEDHPEYPDLMSKLDNPWDLFRRFRPDDPGFTSDPRMNPFATGPERHRIDFVFYRPSAGFNLTVDDAEVVFDAGDVYSDHFGVRARVTLTPR